MSESDPTLLAIDATGARCAALVWRSGAAIGSAERDLPRGGGAEQLIEVVEAALAAAGLDWSGVDRIVVARGPGSFTGVRIGVAAARGLALAMDRPAIGVSGFDVIAASARAAGHGADGPVAVVFGRAPRLAWRLYDFSKNPDDVLPPALADAESGDVAALQATGARLFVGPSAEAGGAPAVAMTLDVTMLARLGAAAPDAAERPTPLYLRPPDATPPSLTPPIRLDAAASE